MSTESESYQSSSRVTAFILNYGKKALACALTYLMVPLGMGDIYAYAQPAPTPAPQYQDQAPPPPDEQQQYDQGDQYDQGPPPESYNALSPDQLNQLVAPIALYPDSLVAQILAASTYPTEIADADHFVESNQGAPPDQLGDMANGMDWDPSVKALIAFPSILNNLDRNLDWTSQLGNAYYNQPQDVMSAVQDMRQRAYEAGNLRSTQQLAVDYNPGDIVIAPANPDVVYVPWYDPWTVYGSPLSPWNGYYVRPRPAGLFFAAGLGLGFGIGVTVGHWNNYGWGWNNWGMGWRNRTIVYNRNIYISRSTHVRNHGYYGHFDRNPSARTYNRNIAVRYRNSPNYRLNNNRPNTNNNRNRPAIRPNYERPNNNRPNNNRPNTNVRPAPNFNRDNNRPNTNRPNTNTNRPNNQPAIRPNYQRPNSNVRQAPNFNRDNTRPNTNQPNTSRPNVNRPNTTYNRPNTNTRPAPTFNRPESQPNNQPRTQPAVRPNYERPNNNARPTPNRPEARPESRPQQREARPQARPQSHPEARPSGENHQERGNSDHDKKSH